MVDNAAEPDEDFYRYARKPLLDRLRRGENGLKVYAMCEIPNNVILIDEFAKRFDGFSIGSNDLTQLTLGVDRDSEIVALSSRSGLASSR